jgi:hypothetical protein
MISEFGMAGRSAKWARPSLLVVLCLLNALPIWLVRYPSMVDYPNHLASAYLISNLEGSAANLKDQYQFDWQPYPNLAMGMVVHALSPFVSPYTAGKVLLTLYAVGVPLSLVAFCTWIQKSQWWAGLVGFLTTYGFFFHYGFVNYSLGIPAYFLIFGLFIRWRSRLTPACYVVLAFLLELAYFIHLHAFLALAISLLVYEIALVPQWPSVLRMAGLLVLPLGTATIWWRSFEHSPQLLAVGEFAWKLKARLVVAPWLGFSDVLAWACLVAALVYLIATVRRPWFWDKGLAAVCVVLGALYWILPLNVLGGGGASIRILPFLVGALAGGLRLRSRAVRFWSLVFVVLFLSSFGSTLQNWLANDSRMNSYAAGFSFLPRGARIFPIVGAKDGRWFRHSTSQFFCYAVIERQAFVPTLFHAPSQTALRVVNGLERSLETPDWEAFRNYDFFWTQDADRLLDNLQARGELVFEKDGLRLFRVRNETKSTGLR